MRSAHLDPHARRAGAHPANAASGRAGPSTWGCRRPHSLGVRLLKRFIAGHPRCFAVFLVAAGLLRRHLCGAGIKHLKLVLLKHAQQSEAAGPPDDNAASALEAAREDTARSMLQAVYFHVLKTIRYWKVTGSVAAVSIQTRKAALGCPCMPAQHVPYSRNDVQLSSSVGVGLPLLQSKYRERLRHD